MSKMNDDIKGIKMKLEEKLEFIKGDPAKKYESAILRNNLEELKELEMKVECNVIGKHPMISTIVGTAIMYMIGYASVWLLEHTSGLDVNRITECGMSAAEEIKYWAGLGGFMGFIFLGGATRSENSSYHKDVGSLKKLVQKLKEEYET